MLYKTREDRFTCSQEIKPKNVLFVMFSTYVLILSEKQKRPLTGPLMLSIINSQDFLVYLANAALDQMKE
jgi:hypothetical protein